MPSARVDQCLLEGLSLLVGRQLGVRPLPSLVLPMPAAVWPIPRPVDSRYALST
jgi:hypothetical protein